MVGSEMGVREGARAGWKKWGQEDEWYRIRCPTARALAFCMVVPESGVRIAARAGWKKWGQEDEWYRIRCPKARPSTFCKVVSYTHLTLPTICSV